MTLPTIRLALPDELAVLQAVERAAGELFRDVGMCAIADDEPLSLTELTGYQRRGRAWVAPDDAGTPVGYLLGDVVDGAGHVAQLSVRPDHGRRGLGRALLDAIAGWAGAQGMAAVTLTTFAEVPWNAPFYARLGFTVLAPETLTPGLRAVRTHEAALGLDRWPRVAMRRALPST